MKQTANHIITLLASLLILLLCPGCTHKELDSAYGTTARIRVLFDWRESPDAQPEGMCVYFYPLDPEEGAPRRFDFFDIVGGEIEIATGRYRVLCYNNDTEAILFRGHDLFDTHQAYTRIGYIFESLGMPPHAAPPRAEGTEREEVVITPDMLWGSAMADIEILEDQIRVITPLSSALAEEGHAFAPGDSARTADDPTRGGTLPMPPRGGQLTDITTLTLYPRPLVCHYSYEIRGVTNLSSASTMCGSLSGMSNSLTIGHELLTGAPVTLPVPAYRSDGSTIRGEFLTFGHCPEQKGTPHKLLLYVWLNDGSKFYYTADVTSQIHTAPDRRRVHLILEGLELPLPMDSSTGGLKPTVDGWVEENHDIIM